MESSGVSTNPLCRAVFRGRLTPFRSNFEWSEGYETRFGVTFVDYQGGQQRKAKASARVIGEMFESLTRQV